MLSKRDYQVRPIEGMDSHVHAILQTSDGSMWVPATPPLTFILRSTGGIWCATGRRLYKCTHADLADRLLREGELNVSEVADRIGYASASYFSKSYKTKFGLSPNDVRPR